MIWAVASRKGSPGATTLAALLARLWPEDGEPRTLVEADPDGGVLAARWHDARGVTAEPGLLTLAASREGSASERLHAHAQLVDGIDVIVAPAAPAQVEASLRALGSSAPAGVATAPGHCFVDCGRLSPSSPALAWARHAARVLLVLRPRLDEVAAAKPVVERLCDDGLALAAVCVGDHPYHPLETAEQLGIELAGVVADDPAAAALVYRAGLEGRWLTRSRLGRSVHELARGLAETVPPIEHNEHNERVGAPS